MTVGLRSINSLTVSALATAALMIGGGWLASSVTPMTISSQNAPGQQAKDPVHGGLRVDVQGVRSERGNIVVTIYDQAEALASYSADSYVAYQSKAAIPGTMTIDFPELTEGPYAVTVHHDENANWAYEDEGWSTSGQLGAYDEPPFNRAAVMPGGVSMEMFYYD